MSKHDLEMIAECHPDPERRERARSQLHDRPLPRLGKLNASEPTERRLREPLPEGTR